MTMVRYNYNGTVTNVLRSIITNYLDHFVGECHVQKCGGLHPGDGDPVEASYWRLHHHRLLGSSLPPPLSPLAKIPSESGLIKRNVAREILEQGLETCSQLSVVGVQEHWLLPQDIMS